MLARCLLSVLFNSRSFLSYYLMRYHTRIKLGSAISRAQARSPGPQVHSSLLQKFWVYPFSKRFIWKVIILMPTSLLRGQTIGSLRKSRLLYKVLRFILPLLVLTIAITGLVLSRTSYLSFRETVRQGYTNVLKSSAGEIRAFLENAQKDIEGLTRMLAATKVDRWQQEMALTAFHHIATEFASLALIPRDGEDLVSVGQRLNEAQPEQFEVFQKALGGKTATSGVMVTRERIPYIQIAAPVLRLGQVSQVLLAELNLKAIWDVLEGIQIGKTGMVYILDESGRLIGHREIDRVINALPGVPPGVLERLRESPDAPVEWSEQREGMTYYCLGYNVPHAEWFIVLSQRQSEIYEYLYQNFWLALAITLLVCLVAVVLAWSRVRHFLLPVETLHHQVGQYGRGELDQRFAITSQDEIGELGTAFNEMADSLKQFINREVETARELAHARNLATIGATSSKVAHEVGNLLNNMGFTLNALKGETLGPATKTAVEILEKDAGRVRAFIRNFLQFAKKPELNLQRVSLEGTLRELLYVFRPQAESKGIHLHLEWPSGLPQINVDQRLIHQVINNLLKNSLDAAPPEGRIDITGNIAGDALQVTIADTGPGISPEIKERIFEPFFTTKGKQGTGLGLAICRTIMDAHQGTITCESESAQGTTFVLRLPLR